MLLYLGFKEVKEFPGIVQSITQISNAKQLVTLITTRQNILRDAWLTATKHNRPGLPVGLPLKEAQVKADELMLEIKAFLQNKK